MKQIKIVGNKLLSGEIHIGGAKNSAVALIPASLLSKEICTINNVPNISDKDALLDILNTLNVKVEYHDTSVTIDPTNLENNTISEAQSNKLRASYYFMGVLLARFGYVEMFYPGGCNIGSRPIDLHLKGFEALGAKIIHDEENHKYIVKADKLTGARIKLNFASVGATINIMFAATLAKGTTIIENAAKETEIINIADYLNKMGANIIAERQHAKITGPTKLVGKEITATDLRAGAALVTAGLIADGTTIINDVEHILRGYESIINKLSDVGANIKIIEI